MDEGTFKALMGRARILSSDYGAGYQTGLRRHYHGKTFGNQQELVALAKAGLNGDPRVELGRGYRDGLAGREPAPLMGRPPLPEGEGKTARVEWRTTDARKARAQELATAAGGSLSVWLDALVDQQ